MWFHSIAATTTAITGRTHKKFTPPIVNGSDLLGVTVGEGEKVAKFTVFGAAVGIAARVTVSVAVSVGVAGTGVSVGGTGVNVAVGGGVTCNKSRSPGYRIDAPVNPFQVSKSEGAIP